MGKNVVDTMGGFADYFSATYLSYLTASPLLFTFSLELICSENMDGAR
jgi:hypothetical protein